MCAALAGIERVLNGAHGPHSPRAILEESKASLERVLDELWAA